MMPRPSTPTISTSAGRLVIIRIQRFGESAWSSIPCGPVESARSAAASARSFFRSTFSPANPSNAGSRVMAISTEMPTVPAAARPITVRNGMPTTDRPASAMSTVRPANTTAVPAVPFALAIDSSMSIPALVWPRCRDTMNSA